MKNYKYVIALIVLSALSLGYWIAESDFTTPPAIIKETPDREVSKLEGLESPSSLLDTNPALDQKSDKLSKLKAVIDRQRQNHVPLPWESSDKSVEKFTRNSWEFKRASYLQFLNDMNLSAEEVQKIENLILDREVSLAKVNRKLDQAAFLSPESKRLKEEAKKIADEADSKIAEIIGENQLDELKRWEGSKIERKTVEKLTASLEKNSPMTPEQEQSVLNTLHAERKMKVLPSGSTNPLFEQGESYRKKVLDKLSNILSSDQLNALDDILRRENARWQRGP